MSHLLLFFRSVSINAASLHPKYGKNTAADILEEMKRQDAVGEINVNEEESADRKDRARRSPYPSLVIEVKSTPPGIVHPPPGQTEISYTENLVEEIEDQGASKDVILQLEQLFAKSAKLLTEEPEGEDAFYKALGKVSSLILKVCSQLLKTKSANPFPRLQILRKSFQLVPL